MSGSLWDFRSVPEISRTSAPCKLKMVPECSSLGACKVEKRQHLGQRLVNASIQSLWFPRVNIAIPISVEMSLIYLTDYVSLQSVLLVSMFQHTLQIPLRTHPILLLGHRSQAILKYQLPRIPPCADDTTAVRPGGGKPVSDPIGGDNNGRQIPASQSPIGCLFP